MNNFIPLVIIGLIIYYGGKSLIKLIIEKIQWMLLDKEAIAEKEFMRYKNTFHPEDVLAEEVELTIKGFNGPGVYVFSNQDNHKYYVGQSVDILRRIKEHLSGRGNEDVYYDIKKGNKFTIRLIKLGETDFGDLNSLERHYISKHNSFNVGYNKTKGNR